jgi:2-polyprenyl-3-methyl-5-hydroxy-6-metoxy-1,4-benzoquinol methylase
MPIDLADFIAGTPGRFVPESMQGQLVEAEHLTRYAWASQLAEGRRVLDAGCGLAYGAAMLSRAGARETTAIDVAEEIIEVARGQVPEGVRCEVADVRELPFPDASFDLVVCFEVIEHIDGQDRAFDELRRVCAPGGLVAVSSPNPAAYVAGNPHHVHELTPHELEGQLRRRWPQVRLLQQHNFTASALLDAGSADAVGGERLDSVTVRKLHERAADEAPYSVALAGDELPAADEIVMLSASFEIRDWVERFRAQQSILEAQAEALAEAQRGAEARAQLLDRLAEAESSFADYAALQARADASHASQARLSEQLQAVQERAARAEAGLRGLEASLSWRITRPLRTVKRMLSGFRR